MIMKDYEGLFVLLQSVSVSATNPKYTVASSEAGLYHVVDI